MDQVTILVILKVIHIISSTILFGTGIGTAFNMLMAHRTGNVTVIAYTAKNVVLADWLFTASSGLVQPITGFAMVWLEGYPIWSSWLVMAYILYGVSAFFWFIVLRLQLRLRDLSQQALKNNTELPREYHKEFKTWFWCGWPAFFSFLGVFYLMVSKPELW